MTWLFLILALFHVAGLILLGHLLLSRRPYRSLLLWVFWLLMLPVLGIPLYLLLGTDRIRKKRLARTADFDQPIRSNLDIEQAPDLIRHVCSVTGNAYSQMTRPTYYTEGTSYFEALLEDIRSARRFIHIQTYVWRNDTSGQRVLDALCEAARRGVEVRLLLDELGSFKTDRSFFKPLEEAGGEFTWFFTVQTRRNRFFFNLRNHRKIQIIDAKTVYVGGMNIGDEYTGALHGDWNDLQFRFSGPALNPLQSIFMRDWHFATGRDLTDRKYFTDASEDPAPLPVAVIQSGPDTLELPFLKALLLFCNHAKRRLDLFTPYFVADESLTMAIALAAARGVRVRLMIPLENEHQYMIDIGRSYYEPLLEAGVEIYELPGKVHHAKACIADDDWAFFGSTNLDVRSIRLNFELMLLFQDAESIRELDPHFESLFEQSNRVDYEAFLRRTLRDKLKQGLAKLFSPLL